MKIIKEISEVAAPLIFVVLEQVLFFYLQETTFTSLIHPNSRKMYEIMFHWGIGLGIKVALSMYNQMDIITSNPANIYLFKVNNRNTRKRCEIYSKLDVNDVAEMLLLLTLKIIYVFFQCFYHWIWTSKC